jgi:hypothetical protein
MRIGECAGPHLGSPLATPCRKPVQPSVLLEPPDTLVVFWAPAGQNTVRVLVAVPATAAVCVTSLIMLC